LPIELVIAMPPAAAAFLIKFGFIPKKCPARPPSNVLAMSKEEYHE
jgi:hypothetical protein